MTRLKRSRPSPALIVAIVALVAALAGTAVAADPVANTSVTKKKTKQIAKRIAKKEAGKLLPVGSGELATIDEHTEIVSVEPGTHQSITASCESSETVISGGFRWIHEGGGNLDVRASHREGNAWRANARNNSGVAREFRVHAYCLTTG